MNIRQVVAIANFCVYLKTNFSILKNIAVGIDKNRNANFEKTSTDIFRAIAKYILESEEKAPELDKNFHNKVEIITTFLEGKIDRDKMIIGLIEMN